MLLEMANVHDLSYCQVFFKFCSACSAIMQIPHNHRHAFINFQLWFSCQFPQQSWVNQFKGNLNNVKRPNFETETASVERQTAAATWRSATPLPGPQSAVKTLAAMSSSIQSTPASRLSPVTALQPMMHQWWVLMSSKPIACTVEERHATDSTS